MSTPKSRKHAGYRKYQHTQGWKGTNHSELSCSMAERHSTQSTSSSGDTMIWSGNATIHKIDKEQITNKRRILDYCIWNASEKDKRWNDTQCFQVIPSNDSRGTAIFIRVLKIDSTSSISITKPLNTIRNNEMKISYRAIQVLLRRIHNRVLWSN